MSPTSLAILLGALAFCSVAAAAEKLTPAAVEPLYRAHRFAAQPKLNPEVRFSVTESKVPGLWEALEVQLFVGEERVHGDAFAAGPFLVIDGVVHAFVESIGGHGLMSGVVVGDALYYSYSWGSGMHRSLVGRLTVKDGKPVRQESQPLMHADMFVEKTREGRVRVVTAQWREFNRWENASPLGHIALADRTGLKIIDARGDEVVLHHLRHLHR